MSQTDLKPLVQTVLPCFHMREGCKWTSIQHAHEFGLLLWWLLSVPLNQ